MSQRFKEDGEALPVTILEAGPCLVVQIKTKEKEGYDALQLGFGFKRKLPKPLQGHLKDLGSFRYLREARIFQGSPSYKVGDKIDVSIFKKGDIVKVGGISKGKGFQGVVKRHHFAGSPKTHGHKDQLRMPGSIGATAPQRVFKGTRMAGRMGGGRVTVKGLEVVEVVPEKNWLLVKGAVPGARGTLVEIRSD